MVTRSEIQVRILNAFPSIYIIVVGCHVYLVGDLRQPSYQLKDSEEDCSYSQVVILTCPTSHIAGIQRNIPD